MEDQKLFAKWCYSGSDFGTLLGQLKDDNTDQTGEYPRLKFHPRPNPLVFLSSTSLIKTGFSVLTPATRFDDLSVFLFLDLCICTGKMCANGGN